MSKFVDEANSFYHELDQGSLAKLLDKALVAGAKWHPNGFAVFHLGQWGDGGRIRLHIWPDFSRNSRANHPAVHSHNCHLASRVLTGTYCDKLFDLIPTDDQNEKEVRYAHTAVPQTGSPDKIQFGGEMYRIVERELREVPSKLCHFIPAGEIHETTVDQSEFVATLVLNSSPNETAAILLAERPMPITLHVRPDVSDQELETMLGTLRALVAL